MVSKTGNILPFILKIEKKNLIIFLVHKFLGSFDEYIFQNIYYNLKFLSKKYPFARQTLRYLFLIKKNKKKLTFRFILLF